MFEKYTSPDRPRLTIDNMKERIDGVVNNGIKFFRSAQEFHAGLDQLNRFL
jgi:hypothetical protein